MPISGINGLASGLVDHDAQRYLFCTGQELYTFDPLDIAPMQMTSLPLTGNDLFIQVEYNTCDSDLYGIVNAPPDSIVFVRYDRSANTFQTLLALDPLNTYFTLGGMSYIDPVAGLYGLEHGSIMGIDIATGTLLYDSPIIDPPGESFGHIAFDCGTRQVLGTSYGPAPEGGEGKWVSVVDPTSGIVTHLSNAHTENGLWKPALTGSCVDHTNGTFYWGGVDGAWIGANTTTGAIVYDEVASSLEPIFAVNHFAPCRLRPRWRTGMCSPVYPARHREVNFV
ncbi:MAG: hypothetical protein IPK99_13920 [Flavobacteriales bacterium]|nr:hypothetical protein [Flavobacteriales bacterium]